MKKIIVLLIALMTFSNVFAEDVVIKRAPLSVDEFHSYIIDKKNSYDRSLNLNAKFKLKKYDLEDILDKVPLNEKNYFSISFVNTMNGISKEALYDKIYQSIVDMFVSAKNVIQMQDKASGIIVCKGNTEGVFTSNDLILGNYTGRMKVKFTLKIQVKDGRYKLDIYDATVLADQNTLIDNDMPFEGFLNPDFYNKKVVINFMTSYKRNTSYYINSFTQCLITVLFDLFTTNDMIYNSVSKGAKEDNW